MRPTVTDVSAGHNREQCQNGGTDQDAVLGMDSGGPKTVWATLFSVFLGLCLNCRRIRDRSVTKIIINDTIKLYFKTQSAFR